MLIAVISTEGGILLSLVEKRWPPSFCISTISFAAYLAARLLEWSRGRAVSGAGPRERRAGEAAHLGTMER